MSETSESISTAAQKVDLKPFIDEIEVEITRLLKGGRPKTDSEWEVDLSRLEAVLRDQSRRLAKQLGLAGDPFMLFMLTSGMLSVAWSAFAVRRASLDDKRAFDQRMELIELLSGVQNALAVFISAATAYAEVYKAPDG